MSLQYGSYEPETIRILPSRSSDSRGSPLTPYTPHSTHSAHSQQHAHTPTSRAIAAGAPPFPQHIAVWPSAPPPLGHSHSQSASYASRPPPLAQTHSASGVHPAHGSYGSRRPEHVGRTYSGQHDSSQVARTGSDSSAHRAQAEAYRVEDAYRAEAAYRDERVRGRDRERERRQSTADHRAQPTRRPSMAAHGAYYEDYEDRGPSRTRSMSRPREPSSREAEPTQHRAHRPRTHSTSARTYSSQSVRSAQYAHPSGAKLQVVVLDGEHRKAQASAAYSPASSGHAPVAPYFPQSKKTSFLAKLFGKGGEEARPRW